MPLYTATCPVHGRQDIYIALEDETMRDLLNNHQMQCRVESTPPCFEIVKRVWGFSMPPVMQEHWNYALNEPISSMRQFRDKLKYASEEHETRTGVPTTYEPMDWDDPRIAPKETDHLGRAVDTGREIDSVKDIASQVSEAVAAEALAAEAKETR